MQCNMTVGRGSTRGRRRGPMGPALHLAMEHRLALTWEGTWASREIPVDPDNNMRRAITWEGVRPPLTTSQVGMVLKEI